MSSTFGTLFRVTTFGESHGLAVGVVIDGVTPGVELDLAAIQRELDRRRPGQSRVTTQRKESDAVEVLSGLFEGRTTGAPILMLTASADQDSRTKGYLIGTDDYMAKPFLPVDLKLRIARLLRRTYGI